MCNTMAVYPLLLIVVCVSWVLFIMRHENIFAFLNTEVVQVVEIISHERKGPVHPTQSIPHCWCSGNIRSQGVCSHGIDLVISEYCAFQCRNIYPSLTPRIRSSQAYITPSTSGTMPYMSNVGFYLVKCVPACILPYVFVVPILSNSTV